MREPLPEPDLRGADVAWSVLCLLLLGLRLGWQTLAHPRHPPLREVMP